jgi:hypothetical protein
MNIKKLSVAFLFFSSSLLADSFEDQTDVENSSPEELNSKFDVSNWITIPISFELSSGRENIEIAFPVMPKYVEENGYFTATDDEGMSYNMAIMSKPEKNFNLRATFDFLVDSLQQSTTKRLVNFNYPEIETIGSTYSLEWVDQNYKMTRLSLVESKNFIYFLETNIIDAIYTFDFSMEYDSENYIQMMHDSAKTKTFTSSLLISND